MAGRWLGRPGDEMEEQNIQMDDVGDDWQRRRAKVGSNHATRQAPGVKGRVTQQEEQCAQGSCKDNRTRLVPTSRLTNDGWSDHRSREAPTIVK